MFQLFIQTNSPGELTNWTIPFIQAFRKQVPNSNVTIFLTPCPYATGEESNLARQTEGVITVYEPKDTIKFMLNPFKKHPKIQNGALLFLGGDPFYSKLLSNKLKIPAFAYSEHKHNPGKFFRKVFYLHQDGNLMSERIHQFNTQSTPETSRQDILTKYNLTDQNYCLFFAGSRPQHTQHLIPMYTQIIKQIKIKHPDFQPILGLSPFTTDNKLNELKKNHDLSAFTIIRGESLELLNITKLLITIPGSNTAEAMYMRTPMIVCLFLNKPEAIILDGLVGIITNVPLIGKFIKKLLFKLYLRKPRFYSKPNQHLNDSVVPELIGILSAKDVANKIISYFYNQTKLDEIIKKLETIKLNTSITKQIITSITKEN